jgi:hypothetical protein
MASSHTITINVSVFDRQKLRRAALVQAVADGLTGNEWRAMRRSHSDSTGADLIMMMDCGTPLDAGFEINESSATED